MVESPCARAVEAESAIRNKTVRILFIDFSRYSLWSVTENIAVEEVKCKVEGVVGGRWSSVVIPASLGVRFRHHLPDAGGRNPTRDKCRAPLRITRNDRRHTEDAHPQNKSALRDLSPKGACSTGNNSCS